MRAGPGAEEVCMGARARDVVVCNRAWAKA